MKLRRLASAGTLLALTLLFLCGASGTTAYIVASSATLYNTCTPGTLTSTVEERFDGTVKTDVCIRNTGNVSAYIRAAIVVTWKDAQGRTMPENPVAPGDYTLSLGAGWTQGSDGYYYYSVAVAPGDTTGNLIDRCIQTRFDPDGRRLCVEVLASAIQAVGMGADSAQEAFAQAAK